MDSGTTPSHQSSYRLFTSNVEKPPAARIEFESKTLTRRLPVTTDSSTSMVDSHNGHTALFNEGSLQEEFGMDRMISTLVENHIWLIGLLTCIIIILVVISCSLRSNYFQENYFITRAKEWVHLPLLHQSGQDSLLTAETGTVTSNPLGTETESNLPNCTVQNVDNNCSWVSETHCGQKDEMKSALTITDLDDPQKLTLDMSSLSVNEMCTEPNEFLDQPLASSPCDPELMRNNFKAQKSHFVFNADIFLTKSESLDEARSRTQLRDKCFKANRSVDEILSSRQDQAGSTLIDQQPHSSASSIPCTPKCRKLQERRGSNHSLTIAVKPVETNILPTVVTPRECSAAQFLLTAGNCMSRLQLRSCLKDIKTLHAEFWSIPTNAPELFEQVSGCAIKNRYRYVLPNPQSRVKLPVLDPSDPTSGYINGNYVRAQNGDARAYIATQGPLNNTINDFWLMVWAEKAPAIVMITKLVESGKAKCEPYLPADGETCRYGDVVVSVESMEETSGCTVRQLSLKREGQQEDEIIHRCAHYWYSDWPDHKTPDNPRTLVDLAVTIESLRRGQSSLISPTHASTTINPGPIVVHCSAGVGRTGCFIAICQGLSQLVAEGKVDILGIVCALRCDRGGMVQTAEQYEFIHRGLCLFERSTLSDYAGD